MDHTDTRERGATATVLVVEDDRQAAKILSVYLVQAGYRVCLAHTGDDALLKAEQLRPRAITLDILLPGGDGWEVLAKLKASPFTQDIPVIIVSVLDRQELGFHLGAMDYLVKPVDRFQLLHALGRGMLRGKIPGETRKVMIVVDDPDELNTLAVVLSQEGYDVIRALGRAEGMYLAKIARPALVVMKLLLSEPECVDAVAALRADPLTAHIPILTLMPEASTQDTGYRRIQSVFFDEPGPHQAILRSVSRILTGKAFA
jgi:DNA-binding response OmpR family regulator